LEVVTPFARKKEPSNEKGRRKWPEKEQHKHKTELCKEQLHVPSRTLIISYAQFKSNKNSEKQRLRSGTDSLAVTGIEVRCGVANMGMADAVGIGAASGSLFGGRIEKLKELYLRPNLLHMEKLV
jgi:hypothetical protein